MPPPVTATASALGALAATTLSTLRLATPLVLLNWLTSLPVTRAPVLWPSKLLLKVAPLSAVVVPESGVLVVPESGVLVVPESGVLVVPESGVLVVAGVVAAGSSTAVVAGIVAGVGAELSAGVVL